jgi:hypothetical protein
MYTNTIDLVPEQDHELMLASCMIECSAVPIPVRGLGPRWQNSVLLTQSL